MTSKTVATSIPDAGVQNLVQRHQHQQQHQHQQRCHCSNGCSCGGNSKRRRSILKADVAAAASAEAAAVVAEPRARATKQPVRVEICEHRNKLIFYRQDKGWKVGYFSQHLHRRSQAAAARSGDSLQDDQNDGSGSSSGSSPDCSPSGSPPANQSCLNNQRRPLPLQAYGDLEISVKVIHACVNGCFAINS